MCVTERDHMRVSGHERERKTKTERLRGRENPAKCNIPCKYKVISLKVDIIV